MKKSLVVLSVLLILVFSFACSKPNEAAIETKETTAPAAETVESATKEPVAETNDKYPEKPVVCIIPYTAGGATDVSGRLLASVVPNYLGNALIIENQAGGAAVPGTLAVAQALNDGYTLGFNWMASFVLRTQIMDTGFSIDDFTYICGIVMQHNALFVKADSPFQTLEDLVKYAKEHPGELTYSCGAANSWQELIANTFKDAAGVDALMVPYDGARQSALALMAGDLDFAILEIPTCTTEMQAGSVRLLCTFENERSFSAPDVMTIAEAGYPQGVAMQRSIIIGPADMQEEQVKKLQEAFKKACEDENFLALAKKSNFFVEWVDGKTVEEEIRQNFERMKPIIEKYM